MQAYATSFGIGFVAGMRSMSACAALTWAAALGRTRRAPIPAGIGAVGTGRRLTHGVWSRQGLGRGCDRRPPRRAGDRFGGGTPARSAAGAGRERPAGAARARRAPASRRGALRPRVRRRRSTPPASRRGAPRAGRPGRSGHN
ncbi:hypothetical protein MOF7_22445 [Methylobacterium oryzae]